MAHGGDICDAQSMHTLERSGGVGGAPRFPEVLGSSVEPLPASFTGMFALLLSSRWILLGCWGVSTAKTGL